MGSLPLALEIDSRRLIGALAGMFGAIAPRIRADGVASALNSTRAENLARGSRSEVSTVSIVLGFSFKRIKK